jgi:hypothetical protein
MTDRWYIVKRNWPQTVTRSPKFAGVGGDIWPLDGLADRNAQSIHAATMTSRKHVAAGDYEELLCAQLSVAEAYWAEAQKRFGDAWLLEVTAARPGVDAEAGIDLGFPSGGFSLVETELITQGLPGPRLNEWGLIDELTEALAYTDYRTRNEALEQLDGVMPLLTPEHHAVNRGEDGPAA